MSAYACGVCGAEVTIQHGALARSCEHKGTVTCGMQATVYAKGTFKAHSVVWAKLVAAAKILKGLLGLARKR